MLDICKNSSYSGIRKTIGDFRPRQIGDFFIPVLWGMRTVNILNSGQHPIVFLESPALNLVGNR